MVFSELVGEAVQRNGLRGPSCAIDIYKQPLIAEKTFEYCHRDAD